VRLDVPADRSRLGQLVVLGLVVLLDLVVHVLDLLAVRLVDAVVHVQVRVAHVRVPVLQVVLQAVGAWENRR